jgi:hypothetical protein
MIRVGTGSYWGSGTAILVADLRRISLAILLKEHGEGAFALGKGQFEALDGLVLYHLS